MSPDVLDENDLDLEVQLGLLGDDTEKREAIAGLYKRYKERLMCFLEQRFPFLPSDEAATAVNDAFRSLYEMACEGRLNTERSLRSLLFTIAHRRGVDSIRQRVAREAKDEDFAAEIGAALSGTDTGSAWKTFSGSDNLADKVFAEFRAFVPSLPPKQKLVAEAMSGGVALSDPDIVKEIYRTRRMVISAVEVKGAKQALMKKFREILKKKGVQ